MTSGSLEDEIEIGFRIKKPKIIDYLLNLDHKRGKSKAKYLIGFGFSPDNPDELAEALVRHALNNLPGKARVSDAGVGVIVLEGTVTAPDGREMPLRAVWEPREPLDLHFVTAVPLTR